MGETCSMNGKNDNCLLVSYGLWYRADWYKFFEVSENPDAFISSTLTLEVPGNTETLVNYQTTQRHIPEDSKF